MYRAAVFPERAAVQVLASITQRLTALERRTRWPGAVQFAEDAGPWSITRQALDTGAFTDLVSVTVDPGRWVFHAGVQNRTLVSLATQYQVFMRLDLPALPTAEAGGAGGGLNYDYDHLALSTTAVFTEQTAVTLEVRFNGSSGFCTATDAYVIAVPA